MKIATFNINNVNRRLSNLHGWLREAEPDIVCLQEPKAADTEFPAGRNLAGRLSRGLARREALERRGDPRAVGTGRDPQGLAWRRLRQTMPLS
jgi:endonuclease/exonuclease/phosphatase family metal-dependent hydrolase